ncbi:MAG: M23 family metallopeptidase [Betaproteobacteria bacterium]|nr:M23 family metallopeptidase [Betaproteobacteria bacterium]
MRQRLFITISDARDVRQYSVHSTVGKLLMVALSGHAVLILAGLLGLGWIAWEIDALNLARQALAHEVRADADVKSRQRSQAESELNDIEKQIQRKREELGIINRVTKPVPSSSALESKKVGGNIAQTIKPYLPIGAPLKGGQVSSAFGMRFHPIWMKRAFHKGIDFDIAQHTPVKATADGVVDAVAKSEDGFGLMVSLRHAFNFKTVYAHLDKSSVAEGQIVRKGEVIATSGNTGLSTAPHLHYEVRYDDKPLNPHPFLHPEGDGIGKLIKQARSAPWESSTAFRAP